MNIGIIGAGNIGATLARLLSKAGYQVCISNSRGPETLADLAAQLGPNVQAATVAETARFGEIVIEAIPFKAYRNLPGKELAGKILVTASNYYPQRDGHIEIGNKSQSELVAALLPDTQVVKAFNTIYWEHLRDQGDTTRPVAERRVIFLAGNDVKAKQAVASLIEAIGFGPVDTGSLHEGGKKQEPGTAVYNKAMTVTEAKAYL